MRIAMASLAAALLVACSGGPTEQEENLSATGEHPELTANSGAAATVGMGDPSVALGNETLQPEGPGGPVGLEGSQGQ